MPLKILIIEDNPGDVRLIKEALEEADAGFILEHAERLEEGLEVLSQGGVDALLLDLNLPDSRGLDTLAEVVGRAPHVPVVVLTVMGDEDVAVEAVKRGAQDYLVKEADGDKKLVARSLRYATERKRAEEALRAVNQELEAFAHTISHDLRTPLTAIFGYARTLQMMASEALGEKESEWVELIAQSAQRMNEFIESILEYTRAGKAAGASVRVEPEEEVRQIILEREEIIEAEGVEMAVGEDFPPILVDPIKLSQVLSNLVDNALKYMGDDNPHPRIEIGASREDETVALYVADNGMGIPPEKQETIFEPFTRLEGVESQPGLGIGLCTVKRAVEAWGGEVWVESEPGEGTTFFFTAPSA